MIWKKRKTGLRLSGTTGFRWAKPNCSVIRGLQITPSDKESSQFAGLDSRASLQPVSQCYSRDNVHRKERTHRLCKPQAPGSMWYRSTRAPSVAGGLQCAQELWARLASVLEVVLLPPPPPLPRTAWLWCCIAQCLLLFTVNIQQYLMGDKPHSRPCSAAWKGTHFGSPGDGAWSGGVIVGAHFSFT